ncbi:hypothetical protein GHK92_11715 [Nocardioides sp. dk4132]|uniref:hypothetical protein n=1 Tax=unclassified Nocardioides TaxID=2615069 RepID=UPI001297E100|nr:MULTISPECIES: hypothetical protein [unclassified Nocardioides]MQW76545.1 hypothetical protein [Nocardioides sp. dk4132]QGA07196.1 hypothetical protein GFH29_07225 [Nocardioides sp. dk884]
MTALPPAARPAYDDLGTLQEMHADCRAASANLPAGARGRDLERAARAAVRPAPSILFADYPAEQPKRGIEVSAAAQRLANALHLHLD